MSKYIKLFETAAELEAAKSSMPRPCVAWSPDSEEPYYKPYIQGLINFEDAEVKSILVNSQNPLIDVNGDGEITQSEASDVTLLNNLFKNNTNITEFNEFKYFISIRDITLQFYGCTNLEEITVNNTVSDRSIICDQAFEKCTNLRTLTIKRLKPARLLRFVLGCTSLETLDLSNVDVSNCTTIDSMCNGCTNLTTINMSGWNVPQNMGGATILTKSGVRTIIMDGCTDSSITKIQSLIQGYATAVGFTIVDNTGTGSTNGAGVYTCAKNSSTWTFTPAN